MLADILLAAAFQVGPFYEQRPTDDYWAIRPFVAREKTRTDILWPLFTDHRDWWRFCFFAHDQKDDAGGHQFEIMPLWFSGETREKESYWGLFPIYGHHPHILLMHDIDFALWPLWMRYRMPRKGAPGGATEWMTSQAVLFPLVSWRDDGSWGVWPLAGVNHARESDHRYALWPLVTWAGYREDRDTAGAGSSWMVWPLAASVRRARERQTMFLPPLFSVAETPEGSRYRLPWPLVEWESTRQRDRLSFFPFYEREATKRYLDGCEIATVTRIGWRLFEWYAAEGRTTETRLFPFWVKNDGYFRLWPFCEREVIRAADGHETVRTHALALFPMRWVDAVDRNWAKFWSFYEAESNVVYTDHALLWGLIPWRTFNSY